MQRTEPLASGGLSRMNTARHKPAPTKIYSLSRYRYRLRASYTESSDTRANRVVEIAVAQTMIERIGRRFGLRPQRLAGDTVYGAVRLLKWLVDRSITLHIPVWGKSARHDGTFSRVDFVFDPARNIYVCPGGAVLTSTGNIDLQGQQERLRDMLVETEVHDGGRTQGHPRSQRGWARSRPCIGQHRSVPKVAPGAQESRDVICPHEAHSQA
jgi:hypothetical protein